MNIPGLIGSDELYLSMAWNMSFSIPVGVGNACCRSPHRLIKAKRAPARPWIREEIAATLNPASCPLPRQRVPGADREEGWGEEMRGECWPSVGRARSQEVAMDKPFFFNVQRGPCSGFCS